MARFSTRDDQDFLRTQQGKLVGRWTGRDNVEDQTLRCGRRVLLARCIIKKGIWLSHRAGDACEPPKRGLNARKGQLGTQPVLSMNHACWPVANVGCQWTKDGTLALVALRNIPKRSELVCRHTFQTDSIPFVCKCGSPHCIGDTSFGIKAAATPMGDHHRVDGCLKRTWVEDPKGTHEDQFMRKFTRLEGPNFWEAATRCYTHIDGVVRGLPYASRCCFKSASDETKRQIEMPWPQTQHCRCPCCKPGLEFVPGIQPA
ncbi:hypothetical protein T484DRAFT_1857087 [Baffinella frigidus]|nr:hypothetical protein T484DRAFT_1857087 [Cryptophyta sp. CCMP2293]